MPTLSDVPRRFQGAQKLSSLVLAGEFRYAERMSTDSAQQQETDPVLAAVHAAPVVEANPQEAAAFEEGLAEIEAGHTTTAEQVRSRLEGRGDG